MVSTASSSTRAVQVWLYAVAALIFITLIVGGATRLTESGLSITEWKPVTGVVPPLSEPQWQNEFAKYQQIPQYREVNRGMTIEQFKTIYWWEWTHRFLARTVGAAFLLPFLFFLWRGMIPRALKARLWTIFVGGAGLGAVGWWMVSSGLAGSARVSVSQYRLAFHLTLACLIYAAIVWTARELSSRNQLDVPGRLRTEAIVIAALVLLQIYLGALVAGLDAGMSFNTWPLIDGAFIPAAERLWFASPWWRNLFENTLTVQFDHRMIAYAIWALAVFHLLESLRLGEGRHLFGSLVLAGVVTAQAALGIVTLLNVAPLGLSLAHQAFAIVALTTAVVHAQNLHAGAKAGTVSRNYSIGHGAKAT